MLRTKNKFVADPWRNCREVDGYNFQELRVMVSLCAL